MIRPAIAQPTPIPAFAPELRPPDDKGGMVVTEGGAAEGEVTKGEDAEEIVEELLAEEGLLVAEGGI